MKKSIHFLLFALLTIFITPIQINAQANINPTWNPQVQVESNIINRFKYIHKFGQIGSNTPKVAEVPLTNTIITNKSTFVLVENQSNTLQPYEIIAKENSTPYTIVNKSEDGKETNEENLYDGNLNTYTEFPVLSGNNISTIVLQLVYNSPITTGSLNLQLDPEGQPPTNISLTTNDSGQKYTVIADKSYSQNDLRFPVREAQIWGLTLKSNQPLRIKEISFEEEPSTRQKEEFLRFLMRPGFTYNLYSQPDGYVSLPYLESGNLSSVKDTIRLTLLPPVPNPLYTPPDDDNDGLTNATDNCPNTSNPDQIDNNKNGIGDACEDFDNDGVMNNIDNCPNHPNRDQQDTDGDGEGDQCDDEESRLTERLAFLPWLGIGLGFGIVIILFAITTKKHPTTPKQDNTDTKNH